MWFAEIGMNATVGELVVPDDLREHVLQAGPQILSLTPGPRARGR